MFVIESLEKVFAMFSMFSEQFIYLYEYAVDCIFCSISLRVYLSRQCAET